jgi:hypothetical protein
MEGDSMTMKMLAIMLAATFTIGAATGCHHRGPAESAGQKIDNAAQKAKDTIDPPGPAEKAGRKVDRAVGK